jgi:T5SS/PEP-CTERM-associated repeat protein
MTTYTFNGGTGDVNVANNYTPNSGPPGFSDDVTTINAATSGSITVHEWSSTFIATIAGASITVQSAKNVNVSSGSLTINVANFTIDGSNIITASGGLVTASAVTVGSSGQGTFSAINGGTAQLTELVVGDGATGITGASGSGSNFNVTGNVVVAKSASSSFGITNNAIGTIGGTLTTNDTATTTAHDGFQVNTGGFLTVTGLTTVASKGNDVYSQIWGGGVLNANGGFTIARDADSDGDFWVQDTGSKLKTNSSDVIIGDAGSGTLRILGGATFDAAGSSIVLGNQAGSDGTLRIGYISTDVTSPDTHAAGMIVGKEGAGTFNIKGEHVLDLTNSLSIGLLAGSTGSVSIEQGAAVHALNVGIGGDASPDSSSLSVSGRAPSHVRSLLLFDDQLSAGFGPNGVGLITVSGGGEIRGTPGTTHIAIGSQPNSVGSLDIRDDSIVHATNLQIGGAGNGGEGLVTIGTTGKLTVDDNLHLEAGSIYLTQKGSIVAPNGLLCNGTFNISGTTLGAALTKLSGDGSVVLGAKVLMLTNASGTFSGTISGTGKFQLAGGTEKLDHTSTYTGGTLLSKGTLDLAAVNAAGTGAITFGSGAQTLKIEDAAFSGDAFLTVIRSFNKGDKIDLTDLVFQAGATAKYNKHNHHLTVKSGLEVDTLTLTKPGNTKFKLTDDGNGGTLITMVKVKHHAKENAQKELSASDHDDGFAFANLAGPRHAQDFNFIDNNDRGAFQLAAHSEAHDFGQVHFDWIELTSHPRSDFFH